MKTNKPPGNEPAVAMTGDGGETTGAGETTPETVQPKRVRAPGYSRAAFSPDAIVALKGQWLAAYLKTRAVGAACRAVVGIDKGGAERTLSHHMIAGWRRADESFDTAVADVTKLLQGELEDAGMRRAIGKDGKGSDLLMMFFLKALDPLRYREVATLSEVQEAGKDAMKKWRQGFKVEQREADVERREREVEAKGG